jgi:Dolichyl-phosphate-mannose-protein mannosyltransferase
VTRGRLDVDQLALAAICVGALLLRVIGLQFGLPSVYNPDEVAIMARALSFAKGTLNPENFLYPTFYFYVLFAWVGCYLAFLLITGRADSIAALQRLYFVAPSGIYTAGRFLGAVSGTLTLVPLHRLALRIADRRTALAAALFLAVAPLHVRDSHYVKHDIFATLAIVVAYLTMARVWPAPRDGGLSTRHSVMAGAACGVAFSTHYYTVFLAFPLLFAIVLGWRHRGTEMLVRQVIAAAAASTVVFFALSPYLALEPAIAWRDITANRAIVVDRAVSSGVFAPALRYGHMLLTDSAGLPIVLCGLAGLIVMLRQRLALAVWLLAFPLPFLLFIANTAPASRYLNPIVPFLVLFAAWALSQIATAMRFGPRLFWGAVAVIVIPSLAGSVRVGTFFRQSDTRALAEAYIRERIPSGTAVAIQPHSVVLTPTRESLVDALSRSPGGAEAASMKFQLQLSLDPYPAPGYRLVYLGRPGLDPDKVYVDYEGLGGTAGLTALRAAGVAFVVVKRYNKPDPATLPFLTALSREARQVAVFSPYRPGTSAAEQARVEPFLHNTDTPIDGALERPGPMLEIWELNGPRW